MRSTFGTQFACSNKTRAEFYEGFWIMTRWGEAVFPVCRGKTKRLCERNYARSVQEGRMRRLKAFLTLQEKTEGKGGELLEMIGMLTGTSPIRLFTALSGKSESSFSFPFSCFGGMF